jgi:hypothetical protein
VSGEPLWCEQPDCWATQRGFTAANFRRHWHEGTQVMAEPSLPWQEWRQRLAEHADECRCLGCKSVRAYPLHQRRADEVTTKETTT